ncbi:MAG: peptide ABC transporter substrate-binding protein [Nitrospirae bacterium]|nr:peptide ABC transporter substrate-binding protein [Nitrospirota bacterium]
MLIKKILILLPVIIFVILLQSFFWIPTYDEQVKGNPHRLEEYITASIGDAKVLNPILNADSASSTIVEQVSDGLIDRDEDLRFRGRLAESWDIYEEAYFYVNSKAVVSGKKMSRPGEIKEIILSHKKNINQADSPLAGTLNNIKDIEIISSQKGETDIQIPGPDKNKDGFPDPVNIKVRFNAPPRLKITLKEVDQDFFRNMEAVLGKGYFETFPSGDYVEILTPGHGDKISVIAPEALPAIEHNPVIVFHLRKGVKFHDGHEFDAGDVKFTYQAIMDPRNLSPRTSDYEPVKRLEAVDKYTVRVVYKRLYSPAFGTWAMGILPEHLLNEEALKKEALSKGMNPVNFTLKDSEFSRHPIGTGPFVFREWKSDQYIALDRNETYWEGAPNYKKYTYRIVPDLLTQEMEFYGGAIDSYGVEPHQVERLKDDPKYQNFSGLSFGYSYIGYNMRRELFKDKRVRKALGMAVDTDKIIRYVMYNEAERITGPFIKQTDYYDKSIPPLPYDPEGALKLLGEAGWRKNNDGWLEKDGKRFAFTLVTNSGNDLRKSVLTIAQDSWKKIGIDVKTDVVEWSVFLGKHINTGNFDALILGWSMGIDPDLYQIWHSSQTGPSQLNFVGFINKEADDLIVKIRQEYDYGKQVEYCHQLHRIIADEQPYTFLYVGKWTAVLDKKIVIKEHLPSGEEKIKKITPTSTGNYSFYFNKWIKMADNPRFELE